MVPKRNTTKKTSKDEPLTNPSPVRTRNSRKLKKSQSPKPNASKGAPKLGRTLRSQNLQKEKAQLKERTKAIESIANGPPAKKSKFLNKLNEVPSKKSEPTASQVEIKETKVQHVKSLNKENKSLLEINKSNKKKPINKKRQVSSDAEDSNVVEINKKQASKQKRIVSFNCGDSDTIEVTKNQKRKPADKKRAVSFEDEDSSNIKVTKSQKKKPADKQRGINSSDSEEKLISSKKNFVDNENSKNKLNFDVDIELKDENKKSKKSFGKHKQTFFFKEAEESDEEEEIIVEENDSEEDDLIDNEVKVDESLLKVSDDEEGDEEIEEEETISKIKHSTPKAKTIEVKRKKEVLTPRTTLTPLKVTEKKRKGEVLLEAPTPKRSKQTVSDSKCTLFIRNIPSKTTTDTIKNLTPDILSVYIPKKLYALKKKIWYCFVEFADEAIADKNIELLRERKIKDNALFVDYTGEKSDFYKNKIRANKDINLKQILLKGLSKNLTKAQLSVYFRGYSQVKQKKISQDKYNVTISFPTRERAKDILEKNSTIDINGKKVYLTYAKFEHKKIKKVKKTNKKTDFEDSD